MPRGGPGLAWSQEGLPGGGTTSQDFSKLKKEDSPSQAEACALLVAGGECEVRTVVPGQGAGQPSGQGRPGPRRGRSLGEGAGEGAVEVAVDVAAAGGEAGSLQLPPGARSQCWTRQTPDISLPWMPPVTATRRSGSLGAQAASTSWGGVQGPVCAPAAVASARAQDTACSMQSWDGEDKHPEVWQVQATGAAACQKASLPGGSAGSHSTPSGPAQSLSFLAPAAPVSPPPPSLRPSPCSLRREGASFS